MDRQVGGVRVLPWMKFLDVFRAVTFLLRLTPVVRRLSALYLGTVASLNHLSVCSLL